ncbi:integrase core domain-containing protein [Comamonas sp.]
MYADGHALEEVRDYVTQWMWRYNHERPNMALGGITPKQRLAMAVKLPQMAQAMLALH